MPQGVPPLSNDGGDPLGFLDPREFAIRVRLDLDMRYPGATERSSQLLAVGVRQEFGRDDDTHDPGRHLHGRADEAHPVHKKNSVAVTLLTPAEFEEILDANKRVFFIRQ